jgi:hypothetical protein
VQGHDSGHQSDESADTHPFFEIQIFHYTPPTRRHLGWRAADSKSLRKL